MKKALIIPVLAALFFAAPGMAQEDVPPDQTITVTEAEQIAVERAGPQSELVTVVPLAEVESLIKVRDSFDDQIMDTAQDL